jgi:hypothetical protein
VKCPLIFSANDDFVIFRTADDLIRYIEPMDVDDGDYVVYDSEGRVLSLYTKKPSGPLGFLKNVEIGIHESELVKPDDLRNILISHLETLGKGQASDRDLDLTELIQRAADAGYLQ